VTAVVGVAAPLITWQAALGGENRAASDTRHQADLLELRTVLDGGLEALDKLELAVQLEMVAWEERVSAPKYRAKHLASDHGYSGWLRARDRLLVLLGPNDELVRLYGTAGAGAFAGSLYMYGHQYGPRANSRHVGGLVNAGVRAKAQFETMAAARFGARPY
jgi:hypothetical protein